MERHTSTEARMTLREVLDATARGQPAIITRHGEDVAVLVPLQVEAQGLTTAEDARELEGMVGPLLARGRR